MLQFLDRNAKSIFPWTKQQNEHETKWADIPFRSAFRRTLIRYRKKKSIFILHLNTYINTYIQRLAIIKISWCSSISEDVSFTRGHCAQNENQVQQQRQEKKTICLCAQMFYSKLYRVYINTHRARAHTHTHALYIRGGLGEAKPAQNT